MLKLRSIVLGTSFGIRAVFFLLLSVAIYKHQSPENVVSFLQLLFLQSILVTMLSSSGYFRAMNHHGDSKAEAGFFAAQLAFALIALAPLPLLLTMTSWFSGKENGLILIWLGGISTALAGTLSGLTLQARGPLIAFGPSVVVGVAATIFTFLIPEKLLLGPYILVVFYQVTTFLVLAVINSDIIKSSAGLLFSKENSGLLQELGLNIGYGMTGTISLIVIYLFREHWATLVEAEIAAAVFLVVRYSDTFLQFITMVMARHPLILRLTKYANTRYLAISIGITLLIFTGLLSLGTISAIISPLVFAIVAQLMVDMVRVPQSFVFLHHMSVNHTRNYFIYTVTPMVLSVIIIMAMPMNEKTIDLYLFMYMVSAFGIFVTYIQMYNSLNKPTRLG